MIFIQEWNKEHSEPIAQYLIIYHLKDSIPETTIKASLISLKRKGYLRKAINVKPVAFVRLRSVMTYN